MLDQLVWIVRWTEWALGHVLLLVRWFFRATVSVCHSTDAPYWLICDRRHIITANDSVVKEGL